MAQYKLSGNIDSNKVFLINRSELVGRIDSQFYKENIDFSNFNKLSKIAKVKGGKRIPLGFDYSQTETNYQYLRIANMDEENEFDYSKFKYIDENIFEILKRYEVFENELIISIAGTIGKVKLLINIPNNKRIILTENCAKIIFNNEIVLPKYLQLILQTSFVQKQIQFSYIQTTIPKLGLDKILNLYLPNLPSIKYQQEIVNQYQIAFIIKQQKEAEAKALLESIDSYLLEELGIKLPEKAEIKAENIPTWMNPENLLVKNGRLFMTSSSEVIGQRFDPKPYDTNTKNLKQAIANCKTNSVQLKSLIIHSCAGDWGTDETEAEENQENKKCLVIRATEFDNKYNLNLDNTRVKYRLIKQSKLTRMDIQENDLLIEKSGGSQDQPVGRIAFLSKEILNNNTHISYSNFIHKIRVDSTKINPEYLFYFLKTMHNVKLTETMQSQTNGIRNLIMTNYLTQNIPLADKDKQEIIVQSISRLRTKALQLENEAMQILKQAKSEIEQMILGE